MSLALPSRRSVLFPGSQEYSRRVQRLNPLAYWPLDEASGSVARDASGNGRNGAYTGVTFNVPGADVVVNGTFEADASWTKGAGWTIAAGKATHAAAGGATSLSQTNILVVGQTYSLTYTVSALTAGTITASLGATALTARGADGTYTESGVVTTTTTLAFAATNDCDGSIDDVTCSCSSANGIGDGKNAPYFDGVNDYCNVYSTSLRDAFNGAEGTLLAWAKVSAAGAWTDGTARYVVHLRADNDNYVFVLKSATNNTISISYEAGNVTSNAFVGGQSDTGWMCFAITWSKSAGVDGQVRYYKNGASFATTDTGLGTWVGALAATTTVIGAATTTPTNPWSGLLAHTAVFSRALSPAEIAALSVV